jgi:hypothetical protein
LESAFSTRLRLPFDTGSCVDRLDFVGPYRPMCWVSSAHQGTMGLQFLLLEDPLSQSNYKTQLI